MAQIIRFGGSTRGQADFRSIGSTGLRQMGGHVYEEGYHPELVGTRGANVWQEMLDDDATCSAIWGAMSTLIRKCKYRVAEASSLPEDKAAADFVYTAMHDMTMPWTEQISEISTFIPFGFSVHEIVYKRRAGDARHKGFRSKYRDGRIGWRYLPIRAQNSIQRWRFDETGDILGFEQMAMPGNRLVYIPMSRALLFRTQAHKNNPEGRSIFRGAYTSWYNKREASKFECIGLQKDVTGIPVGRMPMDAMSDAADADQKMLFQSMQDMGTHMWNNTQASIIIPSDSDPQTGKYLYEMGLMPSPGAKQFDLNAIIQRLDQRIAMSTMADFLLMGQSSSSTGSFAMHSDKTRMFIMTLECYLDSMCDVLNQAVSKLLRLNDFKMTDYPRIEHEAIDDVDPTQLADLLLKLSQAGMPLFPNPALEDYVARVTDIPKPLENETPDLDLQPDPGLSGTQPHEELHDASSLSTDDDGPEAGEVTDRRGLDPSLTIARAAFA